MQQGLALAHGVLRYGHAEARGRATRIARHAAVFLFVPRPSERTTAVDAAVSATIAQTHARLTGGTYES